MNKKILIWIFAMVLLVNIAYSESCVKHTDCIGYASGVSGDEFARGCYGCVSADSVVYNVYDNSEIKTSLNGCAKVASPSEETPYCRLYGDKNFLSIGCLSDNDCKNRDKCYAEGGWCVECASDQNCIDNHYGRNWWICEGEEKGQGHCVDNRIYDGRDWKTSEGGNCKNGIDDDSDGLMDDEDPDCYEQCTWNEFDKVWKCNYKEDYKEDNVKDSIYAKCNFRGPACTIQDCYPGGICRSYYLLFPYKKCEDYCTLAIEQPTTPTNPEQPLGKVTLGELSTEGLTGDLAKDLKNTDFSVEKGCADSLGDNALFQNMNIDSDIIGKILSKNIPVCIDHNTLNLFSTCACDLAGSCGCKPMDYEIGYCSGADEKALKLSFLDLEKYMFNTIRVGNSWGFLEKSIPTLQAWENPSTGTTLLSGTTNPYPNVNVVMVEFEFLDSKGEIKKIIGIRDHARGIFDPYNDGASSDLSPPKLREWLENGKRNKLHSTEGVASTRYISTVEAGDFEIRLKKEGGAIKRDALGNEVLWINFPDIKNDNELAKLCSSGSRSKCPPERDYEFEIKDYKILSILSHARLPPTSVEDTRSWLDKIKNEYNEWQEKLKEIGYIQPF